MRSSQVPQTLPVLISQFICLKIISQSGLWKYTPLILRSLDEIPKMTSYL